MGFEGNVLRFSTQRNLQLVSRAGAQKTLKALEDQTAGGSR